MKSSAIFTSTLFFALAPWVFGGPVKSVWPTQYTADFKQPVPPTVSGPEFGANWMQHKYDITLNHIASGYIYSSLSQGKIRVDGAYQGTLESSIFDFTNATKDGQVQNTILSFTDSLKNRQCNTFTVVPAFVLFTPDFLTAQKAVFMGVVQDDIHGRVASWEVLYMGQITVTVFLNENNTVVRYDFAVPGTDRRTFTTTRFFNISPGTLNSTLFEDPC